jgi:ribokinase
MPSTHATSGTVVVVGALNVDLVVRVPALPGPGETVLGTELERHPGGKGGNQAVAAARAGAAVRMIGAVGADADGAWLLDGLAREDVDVTWVARLPGATGTALIAVAAGGENQIVVGQGANGRLETAGLDGALAGARVLLVSLEVPIEAVARAVGIAARTGVEIIVNAAPARKLPKDILDADPIVVANEREIAVVGEAATSDLALTRLHAAGVTRVIETRGGAGSRLVTADGTMELPAHPISKVVDATGAGDAFCGVLAAWLATGYPLADAVRAANIAAALSVERAGARDGYPHRDRIVPLLPAS